MKRPLPPLVPPLMMSLTPHLTLVVCPETGRRFIGIELDAPGFDRIICGLREVLATVSHMPRVSVEGGSSFVAGTANHKPRTTNHEPS